MSADPKELAVSQTGINLLRNPILNKGTAFTQAERDEFELHGLLPPHIATMEEQLQRVRENFDRLDAPLKKYIQLRALQERNETLFYAFLLKYIEDAMPVLYTPTVGQAVEEYSHIFRFPRGIYISPDAINRIDDALRPFRGVELIVATDGEGILGIGDQGTGGMGIPIGKLSLYTAGAGIHPAKCLPAMLDVGVNNEQLLNDPLYLGIRQKRLRGDAYFDFIDQFVQGVRRSLPGALIQWEDFSKQNAFSVLNRYREEVLSFNDDIQGTGAMALAGILTALKMSRQELKRQVFAIFGAGAGGAGIARQLHAALMKEGLSAEEAKARIYALDSRGLITVGREGVEEYKKPLAHAPDSISHWRLTNPSLISLMETIVNAKATVLIGASGQPNTFTEAVAKAMQVNTPRPIIFPLSNPTSRTEARPEDLHRWTDGKAIIATGSPFPPVERDGKRRRIGQGNNSFIFPGIGLGALAVRARKITDEMCTAAAMALHNATLDPDAVFPPIQQFRRIAHAVATAVAQAALDAGIAEKRPEGELGAAIRALMWEPVYPTYRRQK
jgi:malate dehydrogenase (oxaloacetate-decarboxylating)